MKTLFIFYSIIADSLQVYQNGQAEEIDSSFDWFTMERFPLKKNEGNDID